MGVGALLYLPFVLDSRRLFGLGVTNSQLLGVGLSQLNLAMIAALGAVALNYVMGYGGMISAGNAALLAVGAFGGGVLGTQLGLPFIIVVAGSAVFGAVAGVVAGLPSLRVRGLYLLLSTLGLHYVVLYLFKEYERANFGISGVPIPSAALFGFELDTTIRWYFFVLAVLVVAVTVSRESTRSRTGRALLASRDSEVAALSCGVDVGRLRIKAFAWSSAVAAVAGCIQAYYLTNIGSESFSLNLAIGFVAMIIIGGMGNAKGAVAGALVWTLAPTVLKTFAQEVPTSTPLVGGLLDDNLAQVVEIALAVGLIALLMFAPGGLLELGGRVRGGVDNLFGPAINRKRANDV